MSIVLAGFGFQEPPRKRTNVFCSPQGSFHRKEEFLNRMPDSLFWPQIVDASRNPTSPSSIPALAPKRSNLAPTWHENRAKNHPKSRPRGGYPMGPWAQNANKNRKRAPTQQNRGLDLTALPLLSRKSGQHGPNLGSKMEPKWSKNRFCF